MEHTCAPDGRVVNATYRKKTLYTGPSNTDILFKQDVSPGPIFGKCSNKTSINRNPRCTGHLVLIPVMYGLAGSCMNGTQFII